MHNIDLGPIRMTRAHVHLAAAERADRHNEIRAMYLFLETHRLQELIRAVDREAEPRASEDPDEHHHIRGICPEMCMNPIGTELSNPE